MNDFILIKDIYKLDVIIKRGEKAALTDFDILLGAYFIPDDGLFVKHPDNSPSTLKDKVGFYWDKNKKIIYDDKQSYLHFSYIYDYNISVRPALSFSSITDILTNSNSKRAKDGILEVEYGFYPQYAPKGYIQRKLNKEYENGRLKKTGNTFTINDGDNEDFLIKNIDEYEYKGKRYVKMFSYKIKMYNVRKLSNKKIYKPTDIVWIEVEPVKWLVDEKNGIMLSEKLLFSGVRFFDIKMYMDKYFSKDLCQGVIKNDIPISEDNEKKKVTVNDRLLNLVVDVQSEIDNLNIDKKIKKETLEKLKNLSQDYVKRIINFNNNINSSNGKLILDSKYDIQNEYIKKVINLQIELENMENKSVENNDLINQLNKVINVMDEKINDKEKQYTKKR